MVLRRLWSSLANILKSSMVPVWPEMLMWSCISEGAFRCSLNLSPKFLADSQYTLHHTPPCCIWIWKFCFWENYPTYMVWDLFSHWHTRTECTLDEADAITSSVSSNFLHLVNTVSDTTRLQLVPSIKSLKVWFQVTALPLPFLQEGKMSGSKFIHYFSGYPAVFAFCASLPPDDISQNPTNKRIDHSLSEFQTGIGAAVYATLDTEAYFPYQDCSGW